jgi:cyclopropane-fatty-acyl-phospholipid synthase
MAARSDLDFTYSLIDRIVRSSLGEMADFSGAKYDGDFSLSLEDAQRRKHDYVAEQIGIEAGSRVLDLGCGWGALLADIRRRAANGTGVTLPGAQAASCGRNGLDVHLRDARLVTAETFGRFDAVASLGAFEHFCSVEDYHAGRQDRIYASLFENVAGMLPAGGRLYLQTMVFGPRVTPIGEVSIDAPRNSDAWYLALMQKQFPGSFLSFGQEQVIAAAAPTLRIVSSASGRLDYIETIRQWRQRFAQPSLRKTLMKLRLIPRWLTSADFRLAFTSGVSANSVCFERELLEHYRLVFEKPGQRQSTKDNRPRRSVPPDRAKPARPCVVPSGCLRRRVEVQSHAGAPVWRPLTHGVVRCRGPGGFRLCGRRPVGRRGGRRPRTRRAARLGRHGGAPGRGDRGVGAGRGALRE